VAVSLPAIVATTLLTIAALQLWRKQLSAHAFQQPPLRFPLGLTQWLWTAVIAMGAVILVGVPLMSLVYKAGLRYATESAPGPPTWDLWLLLDRVWLSSRQQAGLLATSLMLGAVTAVLTGFLALVCAWLSLRSRWFNLFIWVLAGVLWALPGPVLGIGLLETMQGLFDLPGGTVLKRILWLRPSPLPAVWICTLRFFPIALAVQWSLVRMIPTAYDEAAVLEGLGAWRRFRSIYLPLMAFPLGWTMLGVAILTLGELSASKLVTTPGFTPLAHHVFMQMHARADAELAALCLALLLVVACGGLVFVGVMRRLRLSSFRSS
jgi:iron(III) transport system permease protein